MCTTPSGGKSVGAGPKIPSPPLPVLLSSWRELGGESRMSAERGAVGRGTVNDGFRLGLANGLGGGRGLLLLEWVWGDGFVEGGRAGLEPAGWPGLGRTLGEEGWDSSLCFPGGGTLPLSLPSFLRLFLLHISWQSWYLGSLRTAAGGTHTHTHIHTDTNTWHSVN